MRSYTFFFSKIAISNSLINKSFIYAKCSKFLVTEFFTVEFNKNIILFFSISTLRGLLDNPYFSYSHFITRKSAKRVKRRKLILGSYLTTILRLFYITPFCSEIDFVVPASMNTLYLLNFRNRLLKISYTTQSKFFLFKVSRGGFFGYQLGLFGFLPKFRFFLLKNYFILFYKNLILFANINNFSYFNFFKNLSSEYFRPLIYSKPKKYFRRFVKKKTLKSSFIKTRLKQFFFGGWFH